MRSAGFLLSMLLYGAVYSFPALTPAMARDFGTPRSTLQGAFAVWSLAIAALAPLAGRAIDRHGLRRALTIGVVSLVAMLLGLGAVQAPWQVYAVLVGFGTPAQSLISVATLVAAGRMGARARGKRLHLAVGRLPAVAAYAENMEDRADGAGPVAGVDRFSVVAHTVIGGRR